MSLFATIQQSANALTVSQLGLDVTGNNIANANSPGYIRQELIQTPAIGYRIGGITIGYGVRATGVVQKIDQFLVDRMRSTNSDLSAAEAQGEVYTQIEAIFGELGDNDLSSQLSNFSNSIQDMLNQPGNDALRRLVIERGKSLTSQIRTLHQNVTTIADNVTQGIKDSATEINRLTEQIAVLNRRVVEVEGGRTSGSDAVGLRDERMRVLDDLAKIVGIRAVEQPSGSVTVYVGGEYLVSDAIQRKVSFALREDASGSHPEVRIADTDSAIQVSSGRLQGLYEAREGAALGTLDSLNEFAHNLTEQFNRIHTQGQGLDGYATLTSTNQTDDATAPLDLAVLPSKVSNGSFEISVLDLESGQSRATNIRVQLTGGVYDSSLEDIRDQLSAVSGISASITSEGRLRIENTSPTLRFSFQNDTSGFLTAMGVNTFFQGDTASTISINDAIIDNPRLLAASLSGVGGGTENAVKLAQAFEEPLATLNGQSLKQNYEGIVVRTTQDINVQQGVTDGLRNFYKTLESQNLATSGVNLDEEAVKMIYYQRAFQASSRVIKAADELLDTLVNL